MLFHLNCETLWVFCTINFSVNCKLKTNKGLMAVFYINYAQLSGGYDAVYHL